MLEIYKKELTLNKDYIAPIYKYEDILKNNEKGLISSLLTIEEGGALKGDINNLDYFYNKGVRLITLTWNHNNEIANSHKDNTKGLTSFGKEVIKKMNELGMIIDCSHSSDLTFFDVIKYSNKPIVCSHSCVRKLVNHSRNMSDEMLLALKENKGLIGINFYHDFLVNDNKIATILDVANHIDYVKNLIGIDYIGLGSDFDGIRNDNIELNDASLINKLIDELKNRNYSDEEINKITYLNALRIIKENLN